jgi:hypothetical protein
MSRLTSSLLNVPPKLKVINFWGGPGIGKTSAATGLFALMKAADLRVEFVPEVAKDLTYDGDSRRIENQLLILGLQHDRLDRLQGQVDYAVTDSPLPLGLAYLNPRWRTEAFIKVMRETYDQFDNYDVQLRRVKPYQTYGRRQDQDAAVELDRRIQTIFQDFVPSERRWYEDGNEKSAKGVFARLKNQVIR